MVFGKAVLSKMDGFSERNVYRPIIHKAIRPHLILRSYILCCDGRLVYLGRYISDGIFGQAYLGWHILGGIFGLVYFSLYIWAGMSQMVYFGWYIAE